MSKKGKIIVSVVGISIVLLTLLGLTYAYFLTRIQGNTNDKSISVTTADLKLVYGDNSAEILGENLKLVPSDTEIGTKTFTVTNDGNAKTSYVVVIEDVSITKGDTTTTFESNDFRYTLTCTKKDGTSCDGVSTQSVFPINGGVLISNSIDVSDVQSYVLTLWYIDTGVDQSNDMGKTYNAKINITNIESMNTYSSNTNSLAYNIIENARTKANGTELIASTKTKAAVATSSFIYEKGTDPTTFTSSRTSATNYYISYADDYTVNESTGKLTLVNPTVATAKYTTDMASSLVGKYAVWGTSTPSVSNTQNQSSIYKISTSVSDITSTIKYATISSSSLKTTSTERELSVTTDDYGTSYYYRGGVEDNYVNFAGMCWRIVRIEGDGSTKLILEDYNTTCNSGSYTGNWSDGNTYYFGYDSNNKADFINYSGGLADALKSFQTTKMSSYLDKLKVDDWCYDHNVASTYSYGYDDDYNQVTEKDKATNGWYTDEYYGAYKRIYTDKSPSLVCSGTKLNAFKDGTDMYVGTLTADEISFAGLTGSTNYTHYLMNNYTKSNSLWWWALSPSYWCDEGNYDYAFVVNYDGYLYNNYVYGDYVSARPAVSLKSSAQITGGDGTISNPYTIG